MTPVARLGLGRRGRGRGVGARGPRRLCPRGFSRQAGVGRAGRGGDDRVRGGERDSGGDRTAGAERGGDDRPGGQLRAGEPRPAGDGGAARDRARRGRAARARRPGAARCSQAGPSRARPAGEPGAAARAARAGQLRCDQSLDQEDRPQWRQRREPTGRRAQVLAVRRALGAAPGVVAHRAGGLAEPLRGGGELEAHLLAGQVARLARLGQRHPRTNQQGLHRGDGGLQRGRDLAVGERLELAHQQGASLCLGQVADVRDEVAQVLATLGVLLGARPVGVGAVIQRLPALGLAPAHVVQAAVPGDPVEPGADLDLPLVGEDRGVRGREDLLEHVLGILLRAQHPAAEGQEPGAVAVEQHLEGVLVPGAELGDEPLVAVGAQQRARADQAVASGEGCGVGHAPQVRTSPVPTHRIRRSCGTTNRRRLGAPGS